MQSRQSVSTVAHYKTIDVKSHFKIFQSKKLASRVLKYTNKDVKYTTQWLSLEIYYFILSLHLVYIYTRRELQ